MRRRKPGLGVLKFIVLGLLFVTVLGLVTMTLWNCLIPDLFHGPVITFWQALGLLLLGKLLFGWHGPSKGGAPWRNHWREKMRQRMENMTPEERERLRACYGRFKGGGRFWNDRNWDERSWNDPNWNERREQEPGSTPPPPPPPPEA
jgi:hypothetical protein